MRRDLRAVLLASLAVAAPAAAVGAIVAAARGGAFASSVALALWIAAAACLVLMLASGSRLVARTLDLPAVEGWMFVLAAFVLTALGAAVDALS